MGPSGLLLLLRCRGLRCGNSFRQLGTQQAQPFQAGFDRRRKLFWDTWNSQSGAYRTHRALPVGVFAVAGAFIPITFAPQCLRLFGFQHIDGLLKFGELVVKSFSGFASPLRFRPRFADPRLQFFKSSSLFIELAVERKQLCLKRLALFLGLEEGISLGLQLDQLGIVGRANRLQGFNGRAKVLEALVAGSLRVRVVVSSISWALSFIHVVRRTAARVLRGGSCCRELLGKGVLLPAFCSKLTAEVILSLPCSIRVRFVTGITSTNAPPISSAYLLPRIPPPITVRSALRTPPALAAPTPPFG